MVSTPHRRCSLRAIRALEQRGLRAALYEQFVEDLDLPRRYRYVFVPGGSFVLIPRGVTGERPATARRAHASPGPLAVELNTPARQLLHVAWAGTNAGSPA